MIQTNPTSVPLLSISNNQNLDNSSITQESSLVISQSSSPVVPVAKTIFQKIKSGTVSVSAEGFAHSHTLFDNPVKKWSNSKKTVLLEESVKKRCPDKNQIFWHRAAQIGRLEALGIPFNRAEINDLLNAVELVKKRFEGETFTPQTFVTKVKTVAGKILCYLSVVNKEDMFLLFRPALNKEESREKKANKDPVHIHLSSAKSVDKCWQLTKAPKRHAAASFKLDDENATKSAFKEASYFNEFDSSGSFVKLYKTFILPEELYYDGHPFQVNILKFYKEDLLDCNFPESSKLPLVRRLVNALAFLHQQHLIHRDIKGDNILFNKPKLHNDPKAVFCDLDLLCKAEEVDDSNYHVGTFYTQAPEILSQNFNPSIKNAPFALDIWSLGNLLWQLVTGNPPEWVLTLNELEAAEDADDEEYEKAIETALTQIKQFHEDKSALSPLLTLIKRMLSENPLERPMMPEILSELAKIEAMNQGPQSKQAKHSNNNNN